MLGNSSSMESNMTCGLKIDTRSEGWHKTMMKMLREIKGLSYSIDAEGGMAYVSGRVDPSKLLMKLMDAGKHAELCWVTAGSDNYGYNGGMDPHRDPYLYRQGYHSHSYYAHNPFEQMPHYYPPNPYQYHYH